MVSLSLAWVIVTAIKKFDKVTFHPGIFLLTGMIDFFIILIIALAFGHLKL
jgi:hypothetical protein